MRPPSWRSLLPPAYPHLQTAAFIRWYFNTVSLKQSGFCATCSFKILVSERKCKNNLKNRKSQKNYSKILVSIMYTECFSTKIRGFPKILKKKICDFKPVLSSSNEHSGTVTRDHVKSSQMRNETPLQLSRLFFHVGEL